MSSKKATAAPEPKSLLHLGTTVSISFGVRDGDDIHPLEPLVLNLSRLTPEAFAELQREITRQRQVMTRELNGVPR